MGSTRPCAPSSRPTQSRPSTVSPSSSHRATISTLPTACPPRSASPVKRCWTTRLQVVPHESSPHSAASAIRRSPGGSTPNSRRSRPLDPPSSATVTIAVSSRVTRRSADSEAYRPCPPPSATTGRLAGRPGAPGRPASGPAAPCAESPCAESPCAKSPCAKSLCSRMTALLSLLTPQVPVHDLDGRPGAGQPRGNLLGHHHAAVLAAGAAHGEHREVLPGLPVPLQRYPD